MSTLYGPFSNLDSSTGLRVWPTCMDERECEARLPRQLPTSTRRHRCTHAILSTRDAYCGAASLSSTEATSKTSRTRCRRAPLYGDPGRGWNFISLPSPIFPRCRPNSWGEIRTTEAML